jgi:RHS repeat-associated protein
LGEQDAKIFNLENCRICQQQNNNDFDPNQLQQAQKADLQMNADELKKGTIRYKEYKAIPLTEQENAMAEQNTDSANPAIAPPSGVGGLYFYHPDHLGTSTALTDYFGNAYQFFLNLPFGETMAQQLGSNYYNSPYKFNGKELDEETGLYYYGARYYSPRESIWLSVDPLAEKYPNVNPYAFCFNNPINLTDPDGREPTDDIRINTKTKVTEIIRTKDKFDKIFKDGSYVGTTKKGYTENAFKRQGKTLKESSYPQAVGMGAVDGAIAFLAAGGASKAIGLLGSAFKSAVGKVATTFTTGAAVNATTQYIANGGKAGEINMIEACLSGVPRIGPGLLGQLAPVVAGETFGFTAASYKDGITAPNSPAQWGAQVGGGILSFGFGKATDAHLAGEGVGGAVIGEFFKGVVETGSNAAPSLVKK